ncbi:hypothetical protein ASPZODRAFT_135348 [Penicilliopsis zonata CBS 506.65]|uniref:Phosphatidic acid phosphatase type 2/haloperoxidase domain-containing protein n=1 Tax=Penicilliopsis zonata CBS 506.65 TaxID=1073090 RepID=A0A1L9S9X1_9EURO|nr:hypothetical protein ASPZODRAFT_135348 [Penicilliopsis zonata CBS 506.65]OJJ43948.1 hypothetical protein ASPZODRAFT_135348 [Penicilliopsis zonata CBS 506.65]
MPLNGLAARSAAPVAQQPGFAGAFARFYQRSYAPDYIALGVLIAGWLLIQAFVTPFHRMFSLDNKAIQYPFAEVERVPVVMSVIYAGFIPFVILLLWAAMFQPGTHKAQVTILGLFISLMLTSFITDIIKNAVGRPRPDLISRCKPARGTPQNTLVAYSVCTQPDAHIFQEGWRSFPSGHSSFSFAGLGYFFLFLSGQMHVFRPRTDLGRCLLALVPLLGAAMVACSRLADYRHDVYDVTCGSVLGFLVAYFSYRRYYPHLRSVRCDVPYDKADLVTPEDFGRLPDDEERQFGLLSRTYDGTDDTYQLDEAANTRGR